MDDPILPLKSQFWNAWFHEPIPMLDNQSPLQAATTARGRAKLEELLAWRGQMRSQSTDAVGNLDVNVPAAYARWKLGYGPGSPQEFAVEEAILTYTDPRQPTQRQPSHAKKLEKKKDSIFVPRRCEVVGCNKTGKEDTKGCGKCGLAFYCGKEHQTHDWPRHKIDCKAIRKMHLNITPKPFTPARELEKFPLGCFPIVEQEQSDFPVDASFAIPSLPKSSLHVQSVAICPCATIRTNIKSCRIHETFANDHMKCTRNALRISTKTTRETGGNVKHAIKWSTARDPLLRQMPFVLHRVWNPSCHKDPCSHILVMAAPIGCCRDILVRITARAARCFARTAPNARISPTNQRLKRDVKLNCISLACMVTAAGRTQSS